MCHAHHKQCLQDWSRSLCPSLRGHMHFLLLMDALLGVDCIPRRIRPIVQPAEHHSDAQNDDAREPEANLEEHSSIDQNVEKERSMKSFE